MWFRTIQVGVMFICLWAGLSGQTKAGPYWG